MKKLESSKTMCNNVPYMHLYQFFLLNMLYLVFKNLCKSESDNALMYITKKTIIKFTYLVVVLIIGGSFQICQINVHNDILDSLLML